MKLLKSAGVVVMAVAAGLWVTAYGQERPGGSDSRPRRELTILDGRGGRIGVSARDLERTEAERQHLQGGVVIDEVQPDSPADKAGLKRSDVLVEFDGEHVRSARQFSRLVQETAPGRTVKAVVVRDGHRSEVELTPAEGRAAEMFLFDRDHGGRALPGDLGDRLGDLNDRLGDLGPFVERMPPFNFDFDFDAPGMGASRGRLGVTVEELSGQLASYFGAKDGVLVSAVTDGSAASKAGLKAGDVITSVNGESVRNRADLTRALREVKDDGEVTIGIVRDRKESSVRVSALRGSRRVGHRSISG